MLELPSIVRKRALSDLYSYNNGRYNNEKINLLQILKPLFSQNPLKNIILDKKLFEQEDKRMTDID
jgi:hypothetical protein